MMNWHLLMPGLHKAFYKCMGQPGHRGSVVEHQLMKQEVTIWIPGQGTCWLNLWCVQEVANR